MEHVDHRLGGDVFQVRVATGGRGGQSLLPGEVADEIASIHERIDRIDRIFLWHVEVVDGFVASSDVPGGAARGRAEAQTSPKITR